MGFSTIYYICNNESVKKVAAAKMHRFVIDKTQEFPEYSGETLKIAEFFVEKKDRNVQEVLRAVYHLHYVNNDGSINKEMNNLSLRTTMRKITQNLKLKNTNVIDASFKFEEQALNKKLLWEPSEELLQELSRQIFK